MIQQANDNWKTVEIEYPFGGVNLQIDVERIKPIYDSLIINNYPIFVEPSESWYRVGGQHIGSREFLVKDRDGYLLRFSERLVVET